MANSLMDKWEEIKAIVESMEIDTLKSIKKGNKSASLRMRKNLRYLKVTCADMVRQSVAEEKERAGGGLLVD